MFEGLASEIEGLSIPVDGDAMAEAFVLADKLQAKLAEAVAGFDRAELWQIDGAPSMTAWLRDRGGLTGSSRSIPIGPYTCLAPSTAPALSTAASTPRATRS